MSMKFSVLSGLLVLAFSSVLHAQVGIYGTFTAASPKLDNGDESSDWLYGATTGIYFDRGPIGIDARGVFIQQTNNGVLFADKVVAGLAGPRLVFQPRAVPLKVYGELLAGIARTQGGGENDGQKEPTQTGFSYSLVGGADFRSGAPIHWRVVEFSLLGVPRANVALKAAISTGIVIRF